MKMKNNKNIILNVQKAQAQLGLSVNSASKIEKNTLDPIGLCT
jgi:hypothetical protein